MSVTRRGALAAGLGSPLAAPALAQGIARWRMATSWPRNLPGPGGSAQRLAERITRLSGGRIEVQLFGAGEIAPAFGVLGAVASGAVELGHTASFYWQGREPSAALFTSVPFGLTPAEHHAFILFGGGQELWDACYAPFGVKPFLGGNTGVSMGGWFRRRIAAAADLRGLTIRMVGLGGELFQRLGATAIAVPPGDIYPALERGAIDAAEFTAPGSDIQLGLWRVAPFYYAPGFNKPNGSSELIVNAAAYQALDGATRGMIADACAAEATAGLSEMEALNAAALARMVNEHGVTLEVFPVDLVREARRHAADLLAELETRSALARRIVPAYRAFQQAIAPWTRLSTQSVLTARTI
jgi:TRAP-type mannitol/chloroaromatic compound transport system substrate-binding protein